MTTKEINEQLYRQVYDGNEYDDLFPYSECETTKLAKGDTSVTIKEMAKWAKKFAYHSEHIAAELDQGNLFDTVNEIQDFLYNHFQYKIDESDQLLRSPGCAWQQRLTGIDCKSYSIIASTILLNLGIKHYLRRIKQPILPDAYTHVYVVVPTDQTNGDLAGGYLVIDGTIEENREIDFLHNDDVFMSEPKLGIYGLAAGLNCNCTSTGMGNQYPFGMGLVDPETTDDNGGSGDGTVWQVAGDWLKKNIDLGGLLSIFKNGFDLSCYGTTFSSDQTARDIEQNHAPAVEQFLNALASSTTNVDIQSILNSFVRYIHNNREYFYAVRTGHDWRKCSARALDNYVIFYNNVIDSLPSLLDAAEQSMELEELSAQSPMERPELFTSSDIGPNVEQGEFVTYPQYRLVRSLSDGGGNDSQAGGGAGTLLLIGGSALAFFWKKIF